MTGTLNEDSYEVFEVYHQKYFFFNQVSQIGELCYNYGPQNAFFRSKVQFGLHNERVV
jgi:hypothetical protein